MKTLIRMRAYRRVNGSDRGWQDRSPAGLPTARDGSFGFAVGGADFIVNGWFGMASTSRQAYRSTDNGHTWTRIAEVPYSGRHTVAGFSLPESVFVVGGDVFNRHNDGEHARDSWMFNGRSWSRISDDCGIGERSMMAAVHHKGAFYLIGGQKNRYLSEGRHDSVLVSTDNCRSFREIASTPFTGGNLWGACASFRGRIWKVCGGLYDDASLSNRTHPREIYSSADGITWKYEGLFPGQGRQYHQTLTHDDRLWVIGGVNTDNPASSCNLNDTWYSDNGVDWVQMPGRDITALHALTCWTGTDGSLHSFGGSTNPGTVITNKYHVLSMP